MCGLQIVVKSIDRKSAREQVGGRYERKLEGGTRVGVGRWRLGISLNRGLNETAGAAAVVAQYRGRQWPIRSNEQFPLNRMLHFLPRLTIVLFLIKLLA